MKRKLGLLLISSVVLTSCGRQSPASGGSADPASAVDLPEPVSLHVTPELLRALRRSPETGTAAADALGAEGQPSDGSNPGGNAQLAEDATPVELAVLLTETDLIGARYKPLRDDQHAERRIFGLVSPAEGPADFDGLLQRVKALRNRLRDPRQGLAILWEGNRRRAWHVWDDAAGALRASASGWDARVQDPANYRLAMLPGFETTVNYGAGSLYDARCVATIRNLTAEPAELEVGCGYKFLKDGEFVPHVKRQKLPRLAAGTSRKIVIPIGKGNDLPSVDGVHLYAGATELTWFNQYAWDDGGDYVRVIDAIARGWGGRPIVIGDWSEFSVPEGSHSGFYRFEIKGFIDVEDGARDVASREIYALLAAHHKKFHGAGLLMVSAADGNAHWTLSAKGARADK